MSRACIQTLALNDRRSTYVVGGFFALTAIGLSIIAAKTHATAIIVAAAIAWLAMLLTLLVHALSLRYLHASDYEGGVVGRARPYAYESITRGPGAVWDVDEELDLDDVVISDDDEERVNLLEDGR